MILNRAGWSWPPGNLTWPGDEIHVWRATLGLPANNVAALENFLSSDERKNMDRYRFEQDRRRHLVGRGLLRMLLGRYLDVAPHQLRFDYTPRGKPYLAPGLAQQSLEFNVAHSGELVLIAVAGCAVGVDVEQIRADIEVGPIAARFFSSKEQRTLGTLAGALQIDAFFSCWTRKEAYIKARGGGLSLPLDQFDVSLMPGQAAQLLETRPDPAEARRWRLVELDVAAEYKAALAVEGTGWTLRCWDWPAG
jgi:4'-phosphopantetheinyl transferase